MKEIQIEIKQIGSSALNLKICNLKQTPVSIISVNLIPFHSINFEKGIRKFRSDGKLVYLLKSHLSGNGSEFTNEVQFPTVLWKKDILNCDLDLSHSKNLLSLLDFEVVYSNSFYDYTDTSTKAKPDTIILYKSFSQFDGEGAVYLLNRMDAFEYISVVDTKEEQNIFDNINEKYDGNLRIILARCAAFLDIENAIEDVWRSQITSLENTEIWGAVLASWSDYGTSNELPSTAIHYLYSVISDPLRNVSLWSYNYEIYSSTIVRSLLKKQDLFSQYFQQNLICDIIDKTSGYEHVLLSLQENPFDTSIVKMMDFRESLFTILVKLVGEDSMGVLLACACTSFLDSIAVGRILDLFIPQNSIPEYSNELLFRNHLIDLWYAKIYDQQLSPWRKSLLFEYCKELKNTFQAIIEDNNYKLYLNSGKQFTLENLAKNQSLSVDAIKSILMNGNEIVRSQIARRRDLSYNLQLTLANDEEKRVRLNLKNNPTIDDNIKQILLLNTDNLH